MPCLLLEPQLVECRHAVVVDHTEQPAGVLAAHRGAAGVLGHVEPDIQKSDKSNEAQVIRLLAILYK